MLWFIVWMLLTADEPMRDGGMSGDEKDYITACLTSQSHRQFSVQQVLCLLVLERLLVETLCELACEIIHFEILRETSCFGLYL